MNSNSKKILLPLTISAISIIFSSAVVKAEDTYSTGNIAATRAAEQKAAIAKRAERRKKEAEAKKQAEANKTTEEKQEVEAPKEEPAPQ
jgi:hypothetical protein